MKVIVCIFNFLLFSQFFSISQDTIFIHYAKLKIGIEHLDFNTDMLQKNQNSII
jgi:hypothetical protein